MWYAQDGLGSVRAQVDDSALVMDSYAYNPIGVPESNYGAGFRFTGEFMHDDLVYLRARYYDAGLGVFNALDPFEGVHDRPMSLNGYSWAENDPVNNVDPSGMCVAETSACAAAIASPFDLIFGDAIACTAAIACLAQAGYGAYQIHQMLIQETGAPYEDVENAVSQAMQNNTSNTLQPMLTSITPFTDLYCMPGVSSIPQSYGNSQTQSNANPTAVANSTAIAIPDTLTTPVPTPNDSKQVLILGESDSFIYATELAIMHVDWHIVGTKFGIGGNTQQVISKVGNLTLVDDVDGTRLELGRYTSTRKFEDIVFNAPRAMNGWRGAAGDLVEDVLKSSLNVLSRPGHARFSSGGGMPAIPRLNSLVKPGKLPEGYSSATKIPYLSDLNFGVPVYQPTNNNGDPLNVTVDELFWYKFAV